MNNKMMRYVSVLAITAAMTGSAFAQQTVIYTAGGIPITSGASIPTVKVEIDNQEKRAEDRAQELEAAGSARVITQEPVDGIVSPSFRFIDNEPVSGGAGDVFNVTNIENYENAVAGEVYSPVLSTENVNKLYVDNSIAYLQNTFLTEVTSIKNDIRQVTNILGAFCADMNVVDANHNWQKNGSSYEFLTSMSETCGELSWNFEKSVHELIADFAYNQGCSDANANLSVTYRFNGEDVEHTTWRFAHANPHDRAIMFKTANWVDADGDGRDDLSFSAYVTGYQDGFDTCGGTDTGTGDPDDGGETTTYVQTTTPILLTSDKYDASRSYKASGRYSEGYRNYRDWQALDHAYYSNVTTTANGDSVDARITLMSNPSNLYISMSRISSEKNVINIWGTNTADAYKANFRIDLLDGATGEPLFVETILTTGDLDGETSNSENVSYSTADIENYSVSGNSNVRVSNSGGRVTASGKTLNNPGGNAEGDNQKHWFSVRVKGSSVKFSLSPRDQSSGFGFNGQVISESAVTTQN
jgi:hypothetical protein